MAYNAVVITEPRTGNWTKIGPSQATSELYRPSKTIIFSGAFTTEIWTTSFWRLGQFLKEKATFEAHCHVLPIAS